MSQQVDLQEFAEAHTTEILTIASDQEAISWVMVKMRPILGLQLHHHNQSGKKATLQDVPPDTTNEISRFMANLVASRLTVVIQDAVQTQRLQDIEPLLEGKNAQYEWLLTKQIPRGFPRMMTLATSLFHLHSQELPDTVVPPDYTVISEYWDDNYSQFIGSEASWVTVLEEKGVEEINMRLREFWDTSEAERLSIQTNQLTESDKTAYSTLYIHTRLIPVFTAHLLANTIRVKAQAEEHARQSFTRLTQWNDIRQEKMAGVRLCGKWQWTVHNHQNHQDHKLTISFFRPSDQPSDQPKPSKIIVNGDTVYLRWNFPSGFQEDSLLLTNGDKRLEGTFINSRGPYGSITGKRLTTCLHE